MKSVPDASPLVLGHTWSLILNRYRQRALAESQEDCDRPVGGCIAQGVVDVVRHHLPNPIGIRHNETYRPLWHPQADHATWGQLALLLHDVAQHRREIAGSKVQGYHSDARTCNIGQIAHQAIEPVQTACRLHQEPIHCLNIGRLQRAMRLDVRTHAIKAVGCQLHSGHAARKWRLELVGRGAQELFKTLNSSYMNCYTCFSSCAWLVPRRYAARFRRD